MIRLRDHAYPKLASEGSSTVEDVKILTFKFPQFAKYLEERKIPFFGHVGVGIIHPCFRKENLNLIDGMLRFVKKMHGYIVGEHGIRLNKKELLEESEKKMVSTIKARYDPFFKLNPGKVID